MSCLIIGPGLVGSFLGAAANASHAVFGPSGKVRAHKVACPNGERAWTPQHWDMRLLSQWTGPILVTTRAPDTPKYLPPYALIAQNGIGQNLPVVACFFGLDVDADGVLRQAGPPPRVVLAKPARLWNGVLDAWREAGIAVEVRDDARPAQWEKTILNATVGPLCLATGMSMMQVWENPSLQALTLDAVDEGADIAKRCGVLCDRGMRARAEEFFSHMGSHTPSLLANTNELDWTLGHLLTQARKYSVACPSLTYIERMVTSRRVIGSKSGSRSAVPLAGKASAG